MPVLFNTEYIFPLLCLKRFDFDIVNFPFLDGDVPRSTSYGIYITQHIRFARVSSHVADFNARNNSLTAILLQQGYRYLYTTLPHNLIKEKLVNLIEWTFKREGSPYIACNERQAFFTSEDTKGYKLWSCQNVCEALIYLLDNIYIKFGTKLYRQIVGIPMGTNCAPLVVDLFIFCYELNKLKLLKHLNLHLDIWTTF